MGLGNWQNYDRAHNCAHNCAHNRVRGRWLGLGLPVVLWTAAAGAIAQSEPLPSPPGQTPDLTEEAAALCPPPALDRIQTHVVQPGDSLEAIAAQYDLIPSTIIGFNPALQDGSFSPGQTLQIPPHNGIRVTVPPGATWQTLAQQYNRRADVLFEVNGCLPPAATAFIPGVNWTPGGIPAEPTGSPITGYPLPEVAEVLVGYGWQLDPATGEVVFHSGVTLAAAAGTPVGAVGDGIVAFADTQGNYGNLVVINHSQGLQTRYAHLDRIQVTAGQPIRQGDTLGTVGMTGRAAAPQLLFEVRTNSDFGWVAQNPATYVPQTALGRF
jgi:murein DD-endopeptidase MepM/ murein hydrolase activator NlpD